MTASPAGRTARPDARPRATERFEFRIPAEAKASITAAASVLGVDASDFARDVLLERAHEVLAERAVTTVVPASFFDALLAALDEPARANDALRGAATAARGSISADHLQP